jgi:hypothetical protein
MNVSPPCKQVFLSRKTVDLEISAMINAVEALHSVKLDPNARGWDGIVVFNSKVSIIMSSVHVLALLWWVFIEALSTAFKCADIAVT